MNCLFDTEYKGNYLAFFVKRIIQFLTMPETKKNIKQRVSKKICGKSGYCN